MRCFRRQRSPRRYLCKYLDIAPFDVAEKPQNARGLDIDVRTRVGMRVIAEVKTTVPVGSSDFGPEQASSIKKDRDKLRRAVAARKFFFFTDACAHRPWSESMPTPCRTSSSCSSPRATFSLTTDRHSIDVTSRAFVTKFLPASASMSPIGAA